MNDVVSLIIPFIVLVIFGTMVDRITSFVEGIMKPIPYLPNSLGKEVAFLILVALGYLVCWEFDYNLLAYLNHPGRSIWAGYLFTAIILSGGSGYLKQNFDNMDALPNVLNGISGMFRRTRTPSNTQAPIDLPVENNK
jgi:hypothetical protein